VGPGCAAGPTPFVTGIAGPVYTMAADTTYLNWNQVAGDAGQLQSVVRCAKTGCSNSPQLVYAGTADYTPAFLATDDGYTYFVERGPYEFYVASCPFNGCPPQGPNQILQADGLIGTLIASLGYVYAPEFHAGVDGGPDTIRFDKCSIGGCGNTPTPLVTTALGVGGNALSVGHLAADSANLYWTDFSNGNVLECPISGCAAPTVLWSKGPAMGLTVDSTNVYWATLNNGQIVRCAIGGCGDNPTPVLQGLNNPTLLGMDGTALYFFVVDVNGAMILMKVAK
jgi:hypothetical protein